MRKFFLSIALAMILIPLWAGAAGHGLQWDYPADWEELVGYTIYFTDGQTVYNKSVVKEALDADGTSVTYHDMETNLQLGYDISYDIHVKAYNAIGESGPSNIVSFEQSGYVPPADSLPPPVGSEPSDTSGLTIQ